MDRPLDSLLAVLREHGEIARMFAGRRARCADCQILVASSARYEKRC